MKRHRVAVILGLCGAAFSLTTFCHAQTFFDDFNRPDSASVGNGWSNTPGNTGNQNLRILNNKLTTPAPSPGGSAGIYRPFPFTAPLTVSATITPGSGYGGSQLRYGVNFTVLNDGTMSSGYQLTISRADQNYNDSDVSLSDNGVVVGHAFSPFQYGPQLGVQATFSPDGSVIGQISEGANIFSFSFPPRTIQSSGSNFEFSMGGSDPNAAVVTYATLDDLSLFTTSCVPHAATATATVDHGFVVAATITDGGCGYTNTPAVLILGCGGTGATATAVVSNGVVVGITIADAGIGYTCTPNIYISSPLGMEIVLIKAVKPSFLNLSLGTNYQMQVSGNMNTWTNYGAPFTATDTTMIYPQYFDVDNWNSLFFRLKTTP